MANAMTRLARGPVEPGHAADVGDRPLAVSPDDLEEARAARGIGVRGPGPRASAGQRLRPAAALKSLLVLIGADLRVGWGDEPGPRRAYQGVAAGRVAEREMGQATAP